MRLISIVLSLTALGFASGAIAQSPSIDRKIAQQQNGVIIVTITEADLKDASAGANFFSLLRDLYEREHLDLQFTDKPRPKMSKKK